MNAVSIGPLVFDGARFAAVVALLSFFLVTEITARLQQRRDLRGEVARWTGFAVLAWILGARIGFVTMNWSEFASRPLDILKLWQGGFLPAAGWAGGVAIFLWAMLWRIRAALKPLAFGGFAALIAHLAVITALPEPRATLPVMQLITLDGRAVQLAGRDRPVVLNLWATWCPPCRREMPMMTDLASNTPEVDFVFANQGEGVEQINAFLHCENLPSKGMLRDPQNRLMGSLNAVGLPSTLVFDAGGQLIASQTGEVSRATLIQMMTQATGEQE